MSWYDKIFKPKEIRLPNGKTIFKPQSRTLPILLIVLLFSWWSIAHTGFSLKTLIQRGEQFWVILGDMFPPNWEYSGRIIGPLVDTIKMSLLGTVLGGVLAIPFSIIAATNLVKNRVVILLSRFLISLIRTFPALVTALIGTYIFGLGTVAGTFAIFLFTFSYIGKLLYEQIETVDMGPFEAMEAMGYGKMRAFVVSIIPQVAPFYMSNLLYAFEGNVRHAAILGYVGAGGIGLILNEKLGWREYSNVGMILAILFLTVFIIENTSRYIRSKLV